MKRKKSMLSILGVLVLSFSFVSGASASPPVCKNEVTVLCGGGTTKPQPEPPKKCTVAPCPLP